MAEIKVKSSEIDNAITRLRAIVTQATSSKTSPPGIVGGGQSVNELEAIAGVYKDIDSNFITLVQNTISFLSNVEDSFASSDQKAGNKMSGR